jgi:UDP-glucose 4-epimerase
VHLASPVTLDRDPDRLPEVWSGVFDLTDAVARACLADDLRLVVTGTCEEYGDGPAPFAETQAPRPVSPYSTAKAAATHWVVCLARARGLRATVTRPFLTYGPGQPAGRLVPSAISAALEGHAFPMTDGQQTRGVNYVSDVVRGVLSARTPAAIGRVVNIGGGRELSVRAIVALVFAACDADPALIRVGAVARREGETDRFVGDHTLARNLLRHAPRVSLEDGLARTIAAWRASAQD